MPSVPLSSPGKLPLLYSHFSPSDGPQHPTPPHGAVRPAVRPLEERARHLQGARGPTEGGARLRGRARDEGQRLAHAVPPLRGLGQDHSKVQRRNQDLQEQKSGIFLLL